jgi:hypothetical protein
MMSFFHRLLLCTGVLSLAVAAANGAQSEESRSWLEAHADPPLVDVSGTWYGGYSFGEVILKQVEGDRKVEGHNGDYEITGVVSGNRVFLLFFSSGALYCSAVVTAAGEDALEGGYVKGLMAAGVKGITLHLSRGFSTGADAGSRPICTSALPDAAGEQAIDKARLATMVVYRKNEFGAGDIKLPVVCDGRPVAFISNGRYVALHVSPGKHAIESSSPLDGPVWVTLKEGETGYIWLSFFGRWSVSGTVKLVSPEEGAIAVGKIKPVASSK